MQEGMIIDAYAAKFLRLSRFAPLLVAEERDKECRFHLGLSSEVQDYIAMTIMEICRSSQGRSASKTHH